MTFRKTRLPYRECLILSVLQLPYMTKVYLDNSVINRPFDDQSRNGFDWKPKRLFCFFPGWSAENGPGLEVRRWRLRLTKRRMLNGNHACGVLPSLSA